MFSSVVPAQAETSDGDDEALITAYAAMTD